MILNINIRNHCQKSESFIIVTPVIYIAAHTNNASIILRNDIFLTKTANMIGTITEINHQSIVPQFDIFHTISIHLPCPHVHDKNGPRQ